MNVIIRLQNLPWSANALDIRQFFKGLSIPEGGVHIVGGEMGDAFIAFSTDEDARQAMMHDRQAINGIQVRLLLSSRAEMQKVIETARQQSLRALQNNNAAAVVAATVMAPKIPSPIVAPTLSSVTQPQPPVITANSFQSILSNSLTAITPSFLAYQQQAGITLISSTGMNNSSDVEDITTRKQRDRRSNSTERKLRSHSHSRSRSRDRDAFGNSSSRRRRERSRERSRDRDEKNGRRRDRDRSLDRSRSRSRERARDRERSRSSTQSRRDNRNRSRERDRDSRTKPHSDLPFKAYETSSSNQSAIRDNNPNNRVDESNITKSLTSMNNYSLSSFLMRSSVNKSFALQNPYTAAFNNNNSTASASLTASMTTTSSSSIPGIFVEKKVDEVLVPVVETTTTETALVQEPIVFADTNPYEKMYPNLFAQAAVIGTAVGGNTKTNQSKNTQSAAPPTSPKDDESRMRDTDKKYSKCVKFSNMCTGTTYSDLRKFCVALYIPHNGIKMVNDSHGMRVGVAYVQFSRQACAMRVLQRNGHMLRNRPVVIEPVSEDEFDAVQDSFHPGERDRSYMGNRSDYHNSDSYDNNNSSSNSSKNQQNAEPFSVLYIEDIPALTTEQDIMKMFSSYSLYDILLQASPENRREFVAHVRFSREDDAISAYEDRAHHQIGYRRVRIRPGSLEEMEKAKEKIRLANEQLMKEEREAAEEEEKRQKDEDDAAVVVYAGKKTRDQKAVISLDLTQSDGEEEADYEEPENTSDDLDIIANTNKLIDNIVGNDDGEYYDRENLYNDLKISTDNDESCPGDYDSINTLPSVRTNDPRLRKNNERAPPNNAMNNPTANNYNNCNTNFNDQPSGPLSPLNNMEQNFVLLKNCEYSTRINHVAQLLISSNLGLKHIEPLYNDRQLPSGEFIVEFRSTADAITAVKQFHNTQFMSRSLRVFPITPQEISDRLCKPFLGYIPGGNGIKVSELKAMAAALNGGGNGGGGNNMHFNNRQGGRDGGNYKNYNNSRGGPGNNRFNNDGNFNDNENGNESSLPDRFQRPGCVIALDNVPYKAQLSDILNFFSGFDLTPEDIIRRFNDNGMPSGEARVAFDSPEEARKAFEARKRKQIFNRTVYMNIL